MGFDLILQGPLNETSLKNIDNVAGKFENIILSYWSENDIVPGGFYESQNVIETSRPTPDREKTSGVIKDSTFYFSVTSTLEGLRRCKSQYVVKTRSDEKFTDFSLLKELFLKDDERFVFGNIFAKSWAKSAYHIGDHIFVAKTEHLLKGYEFLYEAYTTGKHLFEHSWLMQGYPSYQTAESILAKSFLYAKGIELSTWHSKETLLQNFEVIDINLLGDYIARWNHSNVTYTPKNNRFNARIKHIGDF